MKEKSMTSNIVNLASVVRNMRTGRDVIIRDPRSQHWAFRAPQIAREISVKRMGSVDLEHTIELAAGVEFTCPSSWVHAVEAPKQPKVYQPFSLMGVRR